MLTSEAMSKLLPIESSLSHKGKGSSIISRPGNVHDIFFTLTKCCFITLFALSVNSDWLKDKVYFQSMECSSVVSIATFGPEDTGSNPSWFAVSNSNSKLRFLEYYKPVAL